jgi:hypothetical protein
MLRTASETDAIVSDAVLPNSDFPDLSWFIQDER